MRINNNKIRFRKSGQVAGQVFIYMMAVIVIGGIALIGYKALSTISEKACQAEKASFQMDIESIIEKDTSDGSVKPERINAPCDYDTICFVDASQITTTSPHPAFTCGNNTLIQDSVLYGIKENIFVMSSKRTIPLGYSELVSIASPDNGKCLCIKQRNKNFYLRFTGRSSTTEISAN